MQRSDGSLVRVVPASTRNGCERLPSDSTIARYSALARSSSAKMPASQKPYSANIRSRASFRLPFRNRSKSCNRDFSKMANIGDESTGGSEAGYDASGSEVSSLARDAVRQGSRRRWFAHYDTQSTAFEFVNLGKLLEKNSS